MYRFLTIRRDGPVEHLTLNRPEVRNAFNDAVIAELHDWAAGAAADNALRVVVLGGAGKVFSAGADAAWESKWKEVLPYRLPIRLSLITMLRLLDI